MRGKMRGIRMALLGGAPHSLSACSSRQYATQPPLGRHTQGEHVSVHRDIFGLNYMLAFAPRFFKNKNPRKMSSAKPQPQQTCLGTNVPSGLCTKYVFLEIFWAFLGPCVWGRGRPWYGTSAQPESHFTRSSQRCAPWVVPSTFLLSYFGAFLGFLGRAHGASLVQYLCKTHKSLHGRHV